MIINIKQLRKKIVYCAGMISLLILVYVAGNYFLYGNVYSMFGNGNRHIWDKEDLIEAGENFQFQEDGTFLSVTSDAGFVLQESFGVSTIIIEIGKIDEALETKVFYGSDFFDCFRLHKGINYLQLPNGDFDRFRIEFVQEAGSKLPVNCITSYGSRVIPFWFLALIIAAWIALAKIIHRLIFQQNRKHILLFSVIVVIVCFGIYLLQSFIRYPQLTLNQETLYGENNQNLKDFEIVDAGIRSVSGDPWIEYHLSQPTKIKVIELDISGVVQTGLKGEIFDTDTWNSVIYRVKNGRVLVLFHDKKNPEKQNLRFDLVETNSTYIEVNQIVINSRYGLFCNAIKQLLLALLYIFIYEAALFLLYDFISCEDKKILRKKIPALICMAIPSVLMGYILLYHIFFSPVRVNLFIWMYLLVILSMLMLILQIYNSKKKSSVLEFTVIFLGAALNTGVMEILSGIEYNFHNLNALFWNILLAVFPTLFLYCIIRNAKWAIAISHMFIVILAVINHYFFQFRGNPFELSDFLMADTALTVLGSYTFKIDQELLFCLIFEIGMICCLALMDKRKAKGSELIISLTMSCCILGAGVVYSPDVSYWNMVNDTQNFGYISSFVAYAKHDLAPRKPAGYSQEQILDILKGYEDGRPSSEYPNIIVIMNEAFADLPKTYGFATDEEGTPFIDSLEENVIKGDILVSVFGGSTANTEYEFLTGNTMAFLSEGNVPYMQFIKSEQESLVHELKDFGYQTIAFHPYAAGNYKRNIVYPLLGFDKYVTAEDDLNYRENLRGYMSDEADFLNLIDIYEKRDIKRPFFIFNVTMQNHGGYSLYNSEVDITVKPESEKIQHVQLLEYLSLIKETDRAFKGLVEYFEKEDDKTIIMMFGDHQPGLDADVYNAVKESGESGSVEMSELPYAVPFVLWANYDIESKDSVLTSPNYLRAMLFEAAGIPLSRYDQFLLACQQKYPAINRMGYYDEAGNFMSMANGLEQEGILREYRMLQYANMFDKTAWKQAMTDLAMGGALSD